VDFGIVVEESFWHEEYVIGSAIMIEKIFVKIGQEVSHADRKSVMELRSQTCRHEVRDAVEKLAMQSVMQKSARKKQHKFRKGNRDKIQNTHQVEMEWVNMVTTKLVEWADKVVYIAVGEAKNMVYVKQMMGQHTHKVESDTFRQIKEEEPRIWAGINVWLVYIMKMEDRLIYLCKKYARQEKVILVEVYVRKREKKLTVEDNDMGIMVIWVFVEVIVTVFEMEYITAGMQKSLTVEEGYIMSVYAITMFIWNGGKWTTVSCVKGKVA
jgi:hypothetical protein